MLDAQVDSVAQLDRELRVCLPDQRDNLDHVLVEHQRDEFALTSNEDGVGPLSLLPSPLLFQVSAADDLHGVLGLRVVQQRTIEVFGEHEKVVRVGHLRCLELGRCGVAVLDLPGYLFGHGHWNALDDLVIELRVCAELYLVLLEREHGQSVAAHGDQVGLWSATFVLGEVARKAVGDGGRLLDRRIVEVALSLLLRLQHIGYCLGVN